MPSIIDSLNKSFIVRGVTSSVGEVFLFGISSCAEKPKKENHSNSISMIMGAMIQVQI